MDHPVVKHSPQVRGSTYNAKTGPISGTCHVLNCLLRRRGLLASPHAQLVAQLRSTPQAPRSDVQIAFYPYAFERQDGGVKRARTPAVMFTALASQGRGHGAATLASADPLAPPLIHLEMLADAADRRVLIDGCRLVHRVASVLAFAYPANRGGE